MPATIYIYIYIYICIYIYVCVCVCVCVCMCMEKENSEITTVKLCLTIDLVSYPVRAEGLVNRNTGIITDTSTWIIHQNKVGFLRITSLLLNIVTVSLNSSVPPSDKSMYPCFVNSIDCSLSHFVTAVFLLISIISHLHSFF